MLCHKKSKEAESNFRQFLSFRLVEVALSDGKKIEKESFVGVTLSGSLKKEVKAFKLYQPILGERIAIKRELIEDE